MVWTMVVTQVPDRPLYGLLLFALWSGTAGATDSIDVHSPEKGAVIQSGFIPVLVRLPDEMRFHTASLSIDGQALPLIPTVVRRRWWEGKGTDMIASVPTADLEPGPHRLGVTFHRPTEPRFVDNKQLDDQGGEVEVKFRFHPRKGRVEFKAVDQHGEPRLARIGVFNTDGEPISIGNRQDLNGDPSSRDVPRSGMFAPKDGVVEFLRPGRYRFLASGGIRDGVDFVELDIDESTKHTFTVPRLIETPGELAADLHVHTAMSSDAFIPDTDRFRALASAGVDVAVITEHNRIRDPQPAIDMLNLTDDVTAISGAEFRFGPVGSSIGHANAFPLQAGVKTPQPGESPPAEVMARWRRHHAAHPVASGEPLLIQINHPRGIQFRPHKSHQKRAHALFEELDFVPTKPISEQVDDRIRAVDPQSSASFLDFDVLEIMNRFSRTGWLGVRTDWFALLNRGLQITGTGNSDSHTAHLERVGFPVNLVHVGSSGEAGLFSAIGAGHVRVSTGPLVDLKVRIGDQQYGPSHQMVHGESQVHADLTVIAVPWVPVDEVRLIVNGEVVFRADVKNVQTMERGTWTVPLTLTADSWVIAEAGWPLDKKEKPEESTTYARVALGHIPVGFTNPVWVDVDGNGVWGVPAIVEPVSPEPQ